MKTLIPNKLAVAFPGDEYLDNFTFEKHHVPLGWFMPVVYHTEIPHGWYSAGFLTTSESKAAIEAYKIARQQNLT